MIATANGSTSVPAGRAPRRQASMRVVPPPAKRSRTRRPARGSSLLPNLLQYSSNVACAGIDAASSNPRITLGGLRAHQRWHEYTGSLVRLSASATRESSLKGKQDSRSVGPSRSRLSASVCTFSASWITGKSRGREGRWSLEPNPRLGQLTYCSILHRHSNGTLSYSFSIMRDGLTTCGRAFGLSCAVTREQPLWRPKGSAGRPIRVRKPRHEGCAP
jgi:hypothetical protein